MTDAEIIQWAMKSTLVGAILTASGFLLKFAWGWFWNMLDVRIKLLEDSCAKCRAEMELRLANGNTKFEKLDEATNEIENRTQERIMGVVLKASEANSRHREKMLEEFISVKNFKELVIATMVSNCPNCRKGGV